MYKEIYLFLTNQCPNRCHYCYIKYNNDCLTEKDIDECIEQNKPNRVVFFGGEPLLKKQTIKDTIKYIESKALYTYKNNITLYISAIEPPVIQSDTFYGFTAIHVPSGSLDLYKSANNWSAYGDFMVGDL